MLHKSNMTKQNRRKTGIEGLCKDVCGQNNLFQWFSMVMALFKTLHRVVLVGVCLLRVVSTFNELKLFFQN